MAAFLILGNAARHGDVHSFQRADALGQLVASEKWNPYHNGIVFNAMVALTERRGADVAEKFAEASFRGEFSSRLGTGQNCQNCRWVGTLGSSVAMSQLDRDA